MNGVNALILGKNSRKHEFYLLCETGLRVNCKIWNAEIAPGAIIQCEQQQNGVISHFNLEFMPLTLAQSELPFLHHILEMCTFYILPGSHAPEVFKAVAYLYDQKKLPFCRQFKIIFLMQLLMQIGHYTAMPAISKKVLTQLLTLPIDSIAANTIDLSCQRALRAWLLRCIGHHPLAQEFKTIHVLKAMEFEI